MNNINDFNVRRIAVLMICCFVGVLLSACDPSSEAKYTIRNESDSIVMIELHNVYYNLHKKDSISYYNSYEKSSFELLNNEYVVVCYEWMNHSVEEHTPLWKDIVSITFGSKILSQDIWNENNWESSKSGGHPFSFGEEWDYTLTLTNDIAR